MGNNLSKIGINNLEKLLNDVFMKECDLKATKEELDFIQTGIEALVHDIVDLFFDAYIKYKPYEDYYIVRKRKKLYRNEQRNCHEICVNLFQESLEKIYFPLKNEKQYIKVKRDSSKIIPVGSFYEGTKNNFPNEFDFIFVLFSVKLPKNPGQNLSNFPANVYVIATFIEEVLKKKNILKRKSGTLNDNMELSFDAYVKIHGPASMLRFIYKNGNGTERFIHVDLVGAYEIIVDDNSRVWIEEWFDEYIETDTFCELAKSTDTILVVNGRISLTEIEVDFMVNVLSPKHLRVYRILKFLINGHNDYEAFSRLSIEIAQHAYRDIGGGITSYLIKTAIIHHHDECTNMDTDDLGPCVLQVLQQLLDHFSGDSPLCLYSFHVDFMEMIPMIDESQLRPLSMINDLMKRIRSFQNTKDIYDFDQFRIESVTKQFTDHIREQMIGTKTWDEIRNDWPLHGPLLHKRLFARFCLDNTVADQRYTIHSY